MVKITPKTLQASVILWDNTDETKAKIEEAFGIEVFVESKVPPFAAKVFLPDGEVAFFSYGDAIGRNEDGDLLVVTKEEMAKYYQVDTEEVLNAVEEAAPAKGKKK